MTSPKITALTIAMEAATERYPAEDDAMGDWMYMKEAKKELQRLLNGGLEPNLRLIDEAMKIAGRYIASL